MKTKTISAPHAERPQVWHSERCGSKLLTLLLASAIGCVAFATTYTWTGGAGDGLWTSSGNWGLSSGYPNAADAEVTFSGNATVSLNTGAQTDIAYINVTAGNIVITASSGSLLKINWLGKGNPADKPKWGITVADGASLDLAVPLATIADRFDRYGTGKLTIRDIAITKTGTANWYVYNGTNSFEGSASVTFPSKSDVVFGVGAPHDKSFVFIKDNAQFSVENFNLTSGGDIVPNTQVIQDGAETVVSATTKVRLDCNSANDAHCYTLKRGAISASELTVAPSYLSQSAGGGLYTSPDYAPEHLHYIQEGGTSTFAKVTLTRGSAALRGGVMNYTGADADFKFGAGTKFELSGGTLVWPREFQPANFPRIKWSGTNSVIVPSGKSFTWNWKSVDVDPGAVFKHDGSGTLTFDFERYTSGVGLDVAAGKTVSVAEGATVLAMPGVTDPWKVTLNEGAEFRLAGATSRLNVPLDLTVNGSGKIVYNSFRGAVVAHKLTVDGVEKAKGIYAANGSNSFVGNTSANASVLEASLILVPYVWTGNGGDNRWDNAANWDALAVPPSSDATVVDVSRAKTIILNDSIKLACLVAMPNGMDRRVEITGTGSIALWSPVSYGCGVLVPEGCELALHVGLTRDTSSSHAGTIGLYGGGKLSLSTLAPLVTAGGTTPTFAIDGIVAVTNASYSNSSNGRMPCWSYEGGNGRYEIGDDVTLTLQYIIFGPGGYAMPNELHQTGGSVTVSAAYIGTHNNTVRPAPVYYLEGGEFTGAVYLNKLYSSSWSRYPGGSFEMSGGTMNGSFTGYRNQNYVRLYGGTVNLKADCAATIDTGATVKKQDTNEYTFYLGGVTIRPKDAERSISSGNVWLTGKNGDCKIDVSERNFNFASGNTVAGPGGFVVEGTQTVKSSAAFTFTGAITIKSGNLTCYAASSINGPSALVVENVGSVATFGNGGTFERVVLAQASNLAVSSGKTITTERLVVGGVDVAVGSYTGTYGDGTVVVTGSAPSSWVVDGAGDLSWFADGTATTVDAATTLSSLTYAPVTVGETNALAGAALTFEDGANIHVEKGDTLVIGNNVVFAGKVTKTGWGEVVFNGGVTCSGTPAENNDTGWLTVTEGSATFDGAVTGVRLMTCGAQDALGVPVITLKENCTVSNYAIVLTAWSEGNVIANVTGETHQQGATVDYSDGVFSSLINSSMYPMTKPNGGVGRYVLNSGTLRMCSLSTRLTSFFQIWNDAGTFELVQNGGTLVLPQGVYMVRNNKEVTRGIYTLNGGRVELGLSFSSYSRMFGTVNLNGGTVMISYTGAAFCPRENVALTVDGTVTFETPAGTSAIIANDGVGTVSFVKTDAGSLKLDGVFDMDSLDVQGGTVTLTDRTLPLLDGATDLSIARTATLDLDYDGQGTFKTLKVGDRNRAAGIYSTSQGPTAVKNVLDGDGELRILEGNDPGFVIMVF